MMMSRHRFLRASKTVNIPTDCGKCHEPNLRAKSKSHSWRAILALRGEGNEPIALLFEQGAAMIVAILGVLKAGKIYVPLDPNYPDSRISFMLENSETSLIVSDNHSISHLNPLVQPKRLVLKIDEIGSSVSDENVGLSLAPETAAYIMYTSGSTGEPKGVIQNHRNVVHKVMTHTNDYHITAEDRLSLLYSYSFSASVRHLTL
jgi:non-ribosomal peptide synthetase component F